jgi:4-amino-4-deoxy-L-arabinose transferase-like glycosyltransferase
MAVQSLKTHLEDQHRATHASPLPTAYKLIIIAYGLSLLLIGLHVRTLTRHEVLAAYPAKEMLRGHSWIVPMYAGIARTAKPPLMYWIIASFMKVFESDAEWVVRLPSVLAAVGLAVMLAAFAARFYGARVGLISGLIQLTSVYLLIQSRLAESDMQLVLLVTAAIFVFASGPVAEADIGAQTEPKLINWRSTLFYLLAGISFLLKGLVGPAFMIVGAIVYAIVQRDRRAWRFLGNPIGTVLFLILVAAWPIAAYLKYPAIWESWRFEQFGRLTGERGSNPIFYYFYSIPGSLLPWTPLIILAAWLGLKNGQHRRPLVKFFLCFFIAGLVMLSVPKFKHNHYAYPILPPLSILGAIGLLQFIEHQHRHRRPMHALAAAILVITCIGISFAAFYIPRAKIIAPYVAVMMGLLAVGGLCAIYMEHRRKLVGQLIAIFATAWIIPVLVQVLIIPTVDDYKSEAELARAAKDVVPRDATIYVIDPAPRVEPHSAYYLRPPIRRYRHVEDFLSNGPARPGQPVFLFTTLAQRDELSQHGKVEIHLRRQGLVKPRGEMEPVVISYIANRPPATAPAR